MLGRRHRISLAKFASFNQKAKFEKIVLSVGVIPTDVPKFAVVVPLRYCKKATSRNRTKRLVLKSLELIKDKVKPAIYKIKICDDFSKLGIKQVLAKIEAVFWRADHFK